MKIHFIAIGGSAMHNLALALHDKGYLISGSDDAIYEPSKSRLAQSGLLPTQMGWFAEKITEDLDAVILGMHAKKDNPELLRAQELGLKIYSYPEFIYEEAKEKTRVVIGGSHGKTTITSMILHVLKYWDIEADYLVGAQLTGFDRMVKLSDADFIVIEGDEYLSSPIDLSPKFYKYKAHIALISGIAWDHINVFKTAEDYTHQFSIFLDTLVEGGSITYNEEDVEVKELVSSCERPLRKFPYTTLEHSIVDGVTFIETEEGRVPIDVFGKHNVNNISGAQWICQQMGVDAADFFEAISSFKGAAKRLELVCQHKNIKVYKDFAHAPSKVKASLGAVKEQFDGFKVVACFELHTYSSLNAEFIQQYAHSLDQADEAIVYYTAEALALKNMPELSVEEIRNAFKNPSIEVYTNAKAFEERLHEQISDRTVYLMMSSGNYGGFSFENFETKLVECS